MALFFEQRVPDEVYSGKTFEAWRAEAEAKDPTLLHLSLADVLLDDAAHLSPERFPDVLVLPLDGGRSLSLPLTYRFDPGEDDDGATLTVPLASLQSLDPALLEWTIPGWHEEKIAQLCRSLPRAAREEVEARAAIDDVASALAARLRPFEGPMLRVLADALHEETGVRVAPDAWELDAIPPHLRFFVRVVDGKRVASEGRELRALQERLRGGVRGGHATHAARAASSWDEDDLDD